MMPTPRTPTARPLRPRAAARQAAQQAKRMAKATKKSEVVAMDGQDDLNSSGGYYQAMGAHGKG